MRPANTPYNKWSSGGTAHEGGGCDQPILRAIRRAQGVLPMRVGGATSQYSVQYVEPGGTSNEGEGCDQPVPRAIRGAQGVLPMRVGGAASQLDLPSLTPLSVCGSRFSTGRLLAIEDFTNLLVKSDFGQRE